MFYKILGMQVHTVGPMSMNVEPPTLQLALLWSLAHRASGEQHGWAS